MKSKFTPNISIGLTAIVILAGLFQLAHAATWEDYGCKPYDPRFDNGPVLSRMLAEQQLRSIDVPPVGTLADFYVRTTIEWPNEYGGVFAGSGGYAYATNRRRIGCTRIIWNGEEGGTMLHNESQGGRIQQIILDGQGIAGYGMFVPAMGGRSDRSNLPTGLTITDQLAIVQCKTGIKYANEPDANHADQARHHNLLIHRCETAYHVDCNQSIPHYLFAADFRNCSTGYRFERGGGLHVYGQYFGSSQENPTLLYVGKSTSNNGTYEIQGLQVDATTKNLALVNHGRYAHRVRVSGNVAGGATLVGESGVVNRGEHASKPQYHDVRIDCFGVKRTEGDE